MRIYVASSWRNPYQPEVVKALQAAGHKVYDFRHPAPGNHGFAWSEIDPDWLNWTPGLFRTLLDHPIARAGFRLDMNALKACDACVCVLPCGRSAHLELGWAQGHGKPCTVLMLDKQEPELMYLMLDRVCLSIHEAVQWAADVHGFLARNEESIVTRSRLNAQTITVLPDIERQVREQLRCQS